MIIIYDTEELIDLSLRLNSIVKEMRECKKEEDLLKLAREYSLSCMQCEWLGPKYNELIKKVNTELKKESKDYDLDILEDAANMPIEYVKSLLIELSLKLTSIVKKMRKCGSENKLLDFVQDYGEVKNSYNWTGAVSDDFYRKVDVTLTNILSCFDFDSLEKFSNIPKEFAEQIDLK